MPESNRRKEPEGAEPTRSDPLTDAIIGAAIEVHRQLGTGFLEAIYEKALCRELEIRGIPFEQQKEITVFYKSHPIQGQRLDLLVDNAVVVEIKSTEQDHSFYKQQILSYLRATGLTRGLILNFGRKTMQQGISRVVNQYPN